MKAFAIIALVLIIGAGAYLYKFGQKPAMQEPKMTMQESPKDAMQDKKDMTPEFMAPSDATKYMLDSKASKVTWNAQKKLVDTKHTGTIAFKSGEVYELKDGSLKGKVVVDMATLTDEDQTVAVMKEKLESHLKSADFFDVATYPESVLIFDATKQTDGTYKATGTLTIKNKTNPVEVTFNTKTTDDKTVIANADFEFDRSKFDVKFGSGAFFKDLGDKIIDDNVKLSIEVQATKE